jgi:hypothetical protein
MLILQYTSRLGLVGMLAAGAGDGEPKSAGPRAEPLSRVTQYCVPPEDDLNSYRFYCRTGMADPYRSDGEQRRQKTVPKISIPATKRVG